jgi:alpha-ketoglutarate-dependent taurine dioxygenase
VPVAKPETVEAVSETPAFNEAEVQEAEALATAETAKPKTPLEEVEAVKAEAEAVAEELLPSEEVVVEAAPTTQEVVQPSDEDLQRLEEAYTVKTTEAAKKDQVTKETIVAYDELSKEAKEGKELPAWTKLNTAEKAVYTATNKTAGPDEALKALRDFRYDQEGNVNPPKEEDAALYELNRNAATESHAIEMPKWHALSPESQEAFISGLPKLTRKKTAYTGKDLNSAFEQVAIKLEEENKGVRGAHRLDLEKARLKGMEQEAQARSEEVQVAGKGVKLPESVVEALETEGVNGVLDFISSSANGLNLGPKKEISGAFNLLRSIHEKSSQKIFKSLARTLSRIEFQSTIVTDPNDVAIIALRKKAS